jgi:hypothetical protein
MPPGERQIRSDVLQQVSIEKLYAVACLGRNTLKWLGWMRKVKTEKFYYIFGRFYLQNDYLHQITFINEK